MSEASDQAVDVRALGEAIKATTSTFKNAFIEQVKI